MNKQACRPAHDSALRLYLHLLPRLHAATKSLAIEYAKKGVRVNAVSPGISKTPMHPLEAYRLLASPHPMGRMGEVSDVVDAVMYLDPAGFVTGEISPHRRRTSGRSPYDQAGLFGVKVGFCLSRRTIWQQSPAGLTAEPVFELLVAPPGLVMQGKETGIAEIEPEHIDVMSRRPGWESALNRGIATGSPVDGIPRDVASWRNVSTVIIATRKSHAKPPNTANPR